MRHDGHHTHHQRHTVHNSNSYHDDQVIIPTLVCCNSQLLNDTKERTVSAHRIGQFFDILGLEACLSCDLEWFAIKINSIHFLQYNQSILSEINLQYLKEFIVSIHFFRIVITCKQPEEVQSRMV